MTPPQKNNCHTVDTEHNLSRSICHVILIYIRGEAGESDTVCSSSDGFSDQSDAVIWLIVGELMLCYDDTRMVNGQHLCGSWGRDPFLAGRVRKTRSSVPSAHNSIYKIANFKRQKTEA